jgi:GTP-binding protein
LLPEDRWMLRALAQSNTRTLVILTKADKGGAEWASKCNIMAESLYKEMQRLEAQLNNGWRREAGWSPHIYVTAATMNNAVKTGNGGGLGGARLAMLDMAGFNFQAAVELKPQSVAYAGPIVSFDDIKWAD